MMDLYDIARANVEEYERIAESLGRVRMAERLTREVKPAKPERELPYRHERPAEPFPLSF